MVFLLARPSALRGSCDAVCSGKKIWKNPISLRVTTTNDTSFVRELHSDLHQTGNVGDANVATMVLGRGCEDVSAYSVDP